TAETFRAERELPWSPAKFRMRPLKKLRRVGLIIALVLAGIMASWIYWSWPRRVDMSQYAPADSLAFAEANDLAAVITGIEQTQAWQTLAPPIGAPRKLSPNGFWLALGRYTGTGYIDAILFSRAQVAVVLSGAQGAQAGSTLTIKPLATF